LETTDIPSEIMKRMASVTPMLAASISNASRLQIVRGQLPQTERSALLYTENSTFRMASAAYPLSWSDGGKGQRAIDLHFE